MLRYFAVFLIGLMLCSGNSVSAANSVVSKAEKIEHNAATVTMSEPAKNESAPVKAGGPPQFAVETFPSQLFWLVISFGTLYLLLSGAALPRIEQGITARASHIHNLLADARRLRDEAEQHKNDMSSAVDAAYQQAHSVLNKAAMDAQEAANRRNHELEAVLQTKQRASEEKIAIARANGVQSVYDAAQLLLPVIVQKLSSLRLSDNQISAALAAARGSNDNGHTQTRGVA